MVHYPPDMKYTVEPLNTTNLAGRDPITGRVVSRGDRWSLVLSLLSLR